MLAGIFNYIAALAALLLVLPSIAVGVRRLHDVGRAGWWIWIPGILAASASYVWSWLWVLYVISTLAVLWWLVSPGNAEANMYGEPVTEIAEAGGHSDA